MDGMPQSRRHRDWLSPIEALMRLINRAFAFLACLLVLVIMALIVVAVFYRYVLQDPIAWVLDITIFLLVFVFFLAVAPALESGSHIEVDLFDPLIPPWAYKGVRLIGKILTLIFAIVFFWFVLAYYREIVEVDELSFTMITVQLKLIYWIGPIGALQFLVTAVVLLIRFWQEPLPVEDDRPAAGAH
jgi:TRAP-type C4-dicarboxylate transport system permease small subunit